MNRWNKENFQGSETALYEAVDTHGRCVMVDACDCINQTVIAKVNPSLDHGLLGDNDVTAESSIVTNTIWWEMLTEGERL